MVEFFQQVFSNKIVLSVVMAYVVASLIKLFFYYLGTDEWDWKVFFRTGGMPSSHTASVTAMTAAIYYLEGVSNLFIISLIVSSIVIADAVGVRRAVGKQAQVMNKVIDEFRYFRKFRTRRLYELLGHTPKQAIAGFIVGLFVTRLVFLLF